MPEFSWSKKQGRYQYRNGKPLSDDTIGEWLNEAIAKSQQRVDSLTIDLVEGRINVAHWSTDIRAEIRAAHRFAFQIAYGPNLTPKQLGRLGAVVRGQYKYLDQFANAIENGDLSLAPALSSRAQMYVDAVWNSWQNEQVETRKTKGFTEQRNILSAKGTSCAGCIAESARGWVKIGELIPIGSRNCSVRDRCHFEFR